MSEKPRLWATVSIRCCRKIKIPVYGTIQSIQGRRCGLYEIECYSQAAVSYYIDICYRLKKYLKLRKIDYGFEELATEDMAILCTRDGYSLAVSG